MNKYAWVLEDEASIREMVGQTLVESGYRIQAYASPADTVHEGEGEGAEEPHLIVSDNRMPMITGLEYVRGLRSRGKNTRHIALMSGDWCPKDREEAESLGCKVFCKPFRMSELKKWVMSLAHGD